MAHVAEVLEAKGLEGGRTLLMYAAAAGRKAWFVALVEDTKRKVTAVYTWQSPPPSRLGTTV